MSDPFAPPNPSSPSDPFARSREADERPADQPFPADQTFSAPLPFSDEVSSVFGSDTPFAEGRPEAPRLHAPPYPPLLQTEGTRQPASPEPPQDLVGGAFPSSPFPGDLPAQSDDAVRSDSLSQSDSPAQNDRGTQVGAAPQSYGEMQNHDASQNYGASQEYGGSPAYSANPIYPPGLGYGAYPRARPGMSTRSKLILVAAIASALVLALGFLVFTLFRSAGPAARQPGNITSAPIEDGDEAGGSHAPQGISSTPTGQHYRNSSLGLDADLPKDWVKKPEEHSMMYMGGVGGCSVILMEKESLVPAAIYNASLKATLEKDMDGIAFGQAPAWAGPQKPSDALEATSSAKGVPVLQVYAHFYRGAHLVSVIETRKVSDKACQSKLDAFEQSFRLKGR